MTDLTCFVEMERRCLLEMPTEILDIIVNQVALPDKKNLRMVCKKIRDVVDSASHTYYRVILNNKSFNAVGEFRTCKKLHTLIVENFSRLIGSISSTRSILANVNVGELILVGRSAYIEKRVKTTTKPLYYPYLPNEIHVERAIVHWLSMSDLTEGIPTISLKNIFYFTKDTITTLVMSSDIFTNLDKMSLLSLGSRPFPNLTKFEFTLVHHANSAHGKNVKSAIGRIFDWRFQSLKIISFTSMCACCDVGINHWIKFYSCLIAHKHTLQEMQLTHHFHFDITEFLNGNGTRAKKEQIMQIMEDLKSVHLRRLSLAILLNRNSTFPMLQRKIFSNSFEIQLLRGQTHLEVLKLDFGFLFVDKLFELLPSSEDLKACSIHVYGTRSATEWVDLHFLKNCKGLKFLQVVCEQDKSQLSPWRLKGVNNLSPSIEHLVLSTAFRLNEAQWIQSHLPNLRHIQYYGGIQRGSEYNLLSPILIETNNFTHFSGCIDTMQHLKTFRMSIPNNLITSSLKNLRREVRFEVGIPFSNHQLLYHEQH